MNASNEPGTIRMEARELEMRFASGGRFRLRAMPYLKCPTEPPKVGGQWPLITMVEPTADDGPRQVLVSTEALPGEAYEAFPADVLVVIPVHPVEAARTAESVSALVR